MMWCDVTDIVDGKGASGASIYGSPFEDETFSAIKHDAAGVLVRAAPFTRLFFLALRSLLT